MPCNGGPYRDHETISEYREDLKRLGRICCDMRTILRRHGLEGELSDESIEWITHHDEEDRKRIERERDAGERAKQRNAALAKLTMDERRILGL